jgi:hypothetical protein
MEERFESLLFRYHRLPQMGFVQGRMAKRTYATDADQDSDLPRLIQQQQ